MNYQKGEQIPLYTEFIKDGVNVDVDIPRVRVLKEDNDKILEIMPWKIMTSFGNGYILNFDSNILEDTGEYVIVYEGKYNSEKLNNIDTIEIMCADEADISSPNSVKIYGFVNELGNHKLLENVEIKVKNLDSNTISALAQSDYSGRWEMFLIPGEYEFSFKADDHKDKILRVQVGDENSEVQFNNVSLERNGDSILGNGMFHIHDDFTDKTGLGISDINIDIFSLSDLNEKLLATKTDFHGKWEAYLDSGSYLLKITIPSGVEKLFRMNIDSSGKKTITEFKKSDSETHDVTNTTFGSKTVTDYIKDAHGNPISDVNIIVYKDEEEIGRTKSGIEGEFTLNLDPGVYKILCQKNSFKDYRWELKI